MTKEGLKRLRVEIVLGSWRSLQHETKQYLLKGKYKSGNPNEVYDIIKFINSDWFKEVSLVHRDTYINKYKEELKLTLEEARDAELCYYQAFYNELKEVLPNIKRKPLTDFGAIQQDLNDALCSTRSYQKIRNITSSYNKWLIIHERIHWVSMGLRDTIKG